jgi:hypothetical protein
MGQELLEMPRARAIAAMPRGQSDSTQKFAFLSFRPFANDFRRYLIEALRDSGHPCAHVLLKRDAMEIRTGRGLDIAEPVATIAEMTRRVAGFLEGAPDAGRGVVINSAGNSAPDVVLRLWGALRRHLWIYDVFDALRYDARGAKWLQWWLTDRVYRTMASGCCLLSGDLEERYRTGFHLDNASHLSPHHRSRGFDGRIVVTASFDRRTDFALLAAAAQAIPEVTIDLHGGVYDNEPSIVAEIDRLVAAHRNIRYHGRFDMDRIGDLLADYAVGLVPYRADFRMTRFINPDKLYHYLCAGLEVIASPIPAIRHFRPFLYQAADGPGVAAALQSIRAGGLRNPGTLHQSLNWRVRSQELVLFADRLAAADAHG